MRFTLNLATRTYIDSQKLNLILGAVAAFLFLLLCGLSYAAVMNRAEQEKLLGELTAVEARIKASGKGVSANEYQTLLGRIKAANSIIQRKSFNWLGLLDWLETVVPDGVQITSLEPSLKEGKLSISAVARNFQTMRRFLENLEDSKFFTDIYLLNQGEARIDDAQKGVSFSINCKADVKKL